MRKQTNPIRNIDTKTNICFLCKSRAYRNPNQNISKWLGWGFTYIITALMAAAIALTATGAMDVYKGHPRPNPTGLSHWKLGSALMIVAWVLEVAWTCFSLLPSQARRNAPAYWQGTVVCFPVYLFSIMYCS